MATVTEGDQRMNMDPVKDRHSAQALGESYVEAPDVAQPVLESPVRNAEIRSDGELSFALEVLARSRIDALAPRRTDAVRACAHDQGQPFRSLG